MALIVTPGAADANSFATIAEGDTYHVGHLYASVWTGMSSADKEAALIMSCRLISTMPWTGAAVDAIQALPWPRTGMYSRNGFLIASNVIPIDLKYAQIELARLLKIEDKTATNEIQALGLKSFSAGPVSFSFKDGLSTKESAIPANRAYDTMIPDMVRVLLVPSWLMDPRDQDAGFGGLISEVL